MNNFLTNKLKVFVLNNISHDEYSEDVCFEPFRDEHIDHEKLLQTNNEFDSRDKMMDKLTRSYQIDKDSSRAFV